jgi:predicted patatin/cPLA2 family phospholipase
MAARPAAYNAICDRLDELERSGAAYVFRPQHMSIKNTTANVAALRRVAAEGYAQAMQELPAWKAFFG